ncbi:GNAT family N-acetyltransferase [Longispora sp. K20-0274]|uniref:GNAT family N-acetyltransferase n=1 Tax=Longispora sp. K20-0274 TaxID=3088255 RepID=UPI0039998ADB
MTGTDERDDTGTATLARLDGPAAVELADDLAELYAVVYAEAPYHEGPDDVARFRAAYPGQTTEPGFALVAALRGDTLVGAAFGVTFPAGRWWQRATEAPPAEVTGVDTFSVKEWLVHPDARGGGLGRRLLDTLLADRPEPFATLASNPRAAARQIYHQWGWRHVNTSDDTGPFGVMDFLLLPMPRSGQRT